MTEVPVECQCELVINTPIIYSSINTLLYRAFARIVEMSAILVHRGLYRFSVYTKMAVARCRNVFFVEGLPMENSVVGAMKEGKKF